MGSNCPNGSAGSPAQETLDFRYGDTFNGGFLYLSELLLGTRRYLNCWVQLPAALNRKRQRVSLLGLNVRAVMWGREKEKAAPRTEAWTLHQEIQSKPEGLTRTATSQSAGWVGHRGLQGSAWSRGFL